MTDNLEGTAGAVPFWRTDGVAIANVYEWPQYPLDSTLVGRTVSLIYSTSEAALVYSIDGENWSVIGSSTTGTDTAARNAIGWPWVPSLTIQESIGDWSGPSGDVGGATISEAIGYFAFQDLAGETDLGLGQQLAYTLSLIGNNWPTLYSGQSLYSWMNDWNATYPTQTVKQVIATKANLASPALTGVPTAPTAAVGTNTTQVATTAFVLANGGGGGGLTSPQSWQAVANGTSYDTLTAANGSYAVTVADDGYWGDVVQKINNVWLPLDEDGYFENYLTNVSRNSQGDLALDSLLDFYGSPVEVNSSLNTFFGTAATANQLSVFLNLSDLTMSIWVGANSTDTATMLSIFAPGYAVRGDTTQGRWDGTVISSQASTFQFPTSTGPGVLVNVRLFNTSSVSNLASALTPLGGSVSFYALQGNASPAFAGGVYGTVDVSNKVLVKNSTNTQWVPGPDVGSLAKIYRDTFVITSTSPTPYIRTVQHNLGFEAVIVEIWDMTDHVAVNVPSSPDWRIINSTNNNFEIEFNGTLINPVTYTVVVTG